MFTHVRRLNKEASLIKGRRLPRGVKTTGSSAGGVGSIPDQGAKIPHAL